MKSDGVLLETESLKGWTIHRSLQCKQKPFYTQTYRWLQYICFTETNISFTLGPFPHRGWKSTQIIREKVFIIRCTLNKMQIACIWLILNKNKQGKLKYEAKIYSGVWKKLNKNKKRTSSSVRRDKKTVLSWRLAYLPYPSICLFPPPHLPCASAAFFRNTLPIIPFL